MNIIVIVADSLRTDHLGCYGSSVRTPNIDALADDAAVFEKAYSENLTTVPCRAAWWTGKYLFAQRGWQPFEHNDILSVSEKRHPVSILKIPAAGGLILNSATSNWI